MDVEYLEKLFNGWVDYYESVAIRTSIHNNDSGSSYVMGLYRHMILYPYDAWENKMTSWDKLEEHYDQAIGEPNTEVRDIIVWEQQGCDWFESSCYTLYLPMINDEYEFPGGSWWINDSWTKCVTSSGNYWNTKWVIVSLVVSCTTPELQHSVSISDYRIPYTEPWSCFLNQNRMSNMDTLSLKEYNETYSYLYSLQVLRRIPEMLIQNGHNFNVSLDRTCYHLYYKMITEL